MTKTTKALQIKTVERILSLRKNGANLADAKAIVSNEFNVSVYQLTAWFKQHKPTTTTSVTFSEGMDNSTITTNTSNTNCSGTIQVSSSNNFSSCVQMSSSPTVSNSKRHSRLHLRRASR